MSLTLYRKYRPKSFSEIEGQEHIVRTLKGALSSGQVGHAYLFCGPRGTGKTTIARLFAKALNCNQYLTANYEPCNKCDSCLAINDNRSLDMIEIDAASNRGIDEIRNLKESAQVASTGSKYKVFIIDEVHMLTPPAFNALLKTLEEPSGHVIFILATTEPNKVLETILSRVQRFDFKKISHDQIIKKLEKIGASEKLKLDREVLTALADHAGGSLRDAESALAKLISYAGSDITADHAIQILGIVPGHIHAQFLKSIIEKKPQEAIAQINNLFESGIDLENFTKQFINHLRASLIASVTYPLSDESQIKPEVLVEILNVFIGIRNDLKNSPVPQLPLELAVMELTK